MNNLIFSMYFLNIYFRYNVPDLKDLTENLLIKLSSLISKNYGKPEDYRFVKREAIVRLTSM